ncbi:polygalacturonase [Actinidia eriantha]|uniref:polygalacturonase n=1 Tax=Actinidia eriantha TaxID=165200 RepID=UPI0025877924|nr:polygalacturonase [Actinidia eriantha]
MALQRHFFQFVIISLLIPSFILGYTSAVHEDPPHDYHLEEYGYDFKAYPSYITTTGDNDFGSSISHENGIFGLRKVDYGMDRVLVASKTVDVDGFGAKGDGGDDTKAFEKAWKAACSSTSSAVLLVPKKNYLVRPITFLGPCKSDLTMQIYGTIEASDDRSDYRKDGRHWLVFDSVQNLRVEGGGTINGNGQIWWQNSCKTNKALPCKDAPTALTFYKSKHVIVKNLKIENAQQIHVSFDNCVNVQASNLMVTAPENSPNTDGIHVTGTQNIHISSCVIGTGDDCISIVNGSRKVRVNDITCGPGHGISIGSLGYGNSEAHVSDVVVNGAKLCGTTNGVRIKTWQGGSGSASNIKFQNVEMHNVENPIIIDQNYCDQDKPCQEQSSAVQVKNVVYKNIKGTCASNVAVTFDCSKRFPCRGIVLEDVDLEIEGGAAAKALCNNVEISETGVVSPHCPEEEEEEEEAS